MADNTILSTNVGTGDTIRDFSEAGGVKWPAGVVAYVASGSAGAWVLQQVDSTHGMPVAQQGTWSVTVGAALPAGTNVIGHVIVDSGSITANAGTNLNTSALALESGGNLATLAGAVTSAKVQSNVAQINGVAPAMGSGLTGTGVQRVTLATDVALPAGTNVLGGVNQNGTWTVQPGNTANTTPWLFKLHDGTNAMAAFFDLDTGVGTQYLPGFNLRISGSGGSIEAKGQQSMAGSVPVVIASDQGSFTLAATQSGTWNVGTVTALTAITNALPAGSNVIGHVVTDSGSLVQDIPATSGGLSISSFLSTAAVQSTAVKASAGQVYAIEFFNIGATPMYVRLYNQTTAPANTDNANILWRGTIPGNTAGAGFVKTWDKGLVFSTGIGMRCTGGISDTDNTALAASTVMGNVEYK